MSRSGGERVRESHRDARRDFARWWTEVDAWQLGRWHTGQLVVFDAGKFTPAHRACLPDRYRQQIFTASGWP